MSRVTSKKPAADRRKKPRGGAGGKRTKKNADASAELCGHCSGDLRGAERALFVEEEVGRVFCSEECITGFFAPEIDRLEREYHKHLSAGDLSGEEREKYAHLRWVTLEEPDEVWREKTLAGDHRYTLISEFQPDGKPFWCICICLFLRNEPSFLYLAFTTRNRTMTNHYRKGEQVEWIRPSRSGHGTTKPGNDDEKPPVIDGLANEWTEEETLRAQLNQQRSETDIPEEEFSLYEACVEETLQKPDEVWTIEMRDSDMPKMYHFIRHYPNEGKNGVWFVIQAREVADEEQIELIEAFPTRDPGLVESYRRGVQEHGRGDVSQSPSRLVH